MQFFRLMYPHIGSLVGLFRLCGYCSESARYPPCLLSGMFDIEDSKCFYCLPHDTCWCVEDLHCVGRILGRLSEQDCHRLDHLLCYTSSDDVQMGLLSSCKASVQSQCTSARRWRQCGHTASGTGVRWGRQCSSSSWPWPTQPPPPSSSPSPSSTSLSPGAPPPARPCPAHSACSLHSNHEEVPSPNTSILLRSLTTIRILAAMRKQ